MISKNNSERKNLIDKFLVDCCKLSSIYYDGKYQSVKYLCNQGKVVFVEKSRMLDYCELTVPEYNADIDEAIIRSIMDTSKLLKGCESHEYNGCHYCLTFSLM